ncbi:MAG TPA: ATP-grasp domain-containing protein [Candidatus Obscuribacterales bacterium]
MRKIGILGGGQLGMLLAESIFRHGGSALIYDPDKDAPACRCASAVVNRSFTDMVALREFFSRCEAVTFEFENVESAPLFTLEKMRPILPSVSVLRTAQDRILEKTFFKESKLPHAAFATAKTMEQLAKAVRQLPMPIIVKTARGGYDGKGQWSINRHSELKTLLEDQDLFRYEGSGFIVERRINVEMEVSCIVGRSRAGEDLIYPIFENIHTEHILDYTIFPARLPASLCERIQDIALDAARKLDSFGLLCVEFFLSREADPHSASIEHDGWHIYINEIAPRPHNSGHVTRAACTLSQFDVLARILLSIPLTQALGIGAGSHCMGNLLGDIWLAQGSDGSTELNLSSLSKFPEVVDVVIYGKKEARSKRKMGHFVTRAADGDAALNVARAFRESLVPTKASRRQG